MRSVVFSFAYHCENTQSSHNSGIKYSQLEIVTKCTISVLSAIACYTRCHARHVKTLVMGDVHRLHHTAGVIHV